MAVFDNFKNFIRQGKQAASKNSQSSSKHAHTSGTLETDVGDSAANSITSTNSSTRQYDSARTSVAAQQKGHSETLSTSLDSSVSADNKRHQHQEQQQLYQQNQKAGTSSSKKSKQHKFDDAIKQMIAEENQSRSKMPTYPGLEKYQLVEKMGDGAFSIVFRAVELETGEPRAIKVVSKHNLTPSQRASVLKEAAIMRQLNHPSIVHMHAFLETPVHYFIVLELVEGGELFHQIVRLTYFSEDLSRHVITQVAHAVRYLHEEAGVVHRDIKPENLLFTPVPIEPSKKRVLRPGDDSSKADEGVFTEGIGGGGVGIIKLADFGLSKVIWDSKTMTPCGTVGYTAPEIVKDERYSKSVDMWALGCVLYTILCGFPPFYDESIETLTQKVAMGQYTFLSPWWDGISDSAKDLVSRLLTVDPEKRYTIDEFLQHPWISRASVKQLPSDSEVPSHLASYGSVPSTPMNERGGMRGGALKDAFDVSNAVYRLEQEMARRNHKPRNGIIMEEDEENDAEIEADFSHIEHAFDKISIGSNASSPTGRRSFAGSTNRANRNNSPEYGSTRAAAKRAAAAVNNTGVGGGSFFDLHLEGSTLLERRKARQAPVAH